MRGAGSRLPPIVPALALQCFAAGCTLLTLRLSAVQLPLWLAALLSGALAAVLSRLAGLERWWQIIQLLLAPAAVLLLALPLPPWIYLSVFVVLLLVYWSTFRTRVRLHLWTM